MQGRSEPYDSLLIIRGIAASVVVLSHLWWHMLALRGVAPSSPIYWFVPNGFQSVWMFFTLSSFLLTKAFLQGRFAGARQFWMTRARRLLPGFYAVQLGIIALVLLGLASPDYAMGSARDFRREAYILVFAPWVPYSMASQSLNSPIWSVVIEVHFIVLLPFIVRMATIRVLSIALAVWIGVLAVICWQRLSIWPRLYETHYFNAGFFLFGMLAARAKHDGFCFHRYRLPLIALTVVLVIAVNLVAAADVDVALRFGPFLLAPAFFGVIMAMNTSWQKRLPASYAELLPDWRPGSVVEKIGAMSYSLYLIHKFVGLNLFHRLTRVVAADSADALTLMFILVNVAVLVISAVFYIEIESRFRYRMPTDRESKEYVSRRGDDRRRI